ncbi:uncharacterized protein UTRI_04744 [Ustilago trichophora]|uniref:Uncharacterized protein n=1 Tax=Ustilago trichophora TaxID=86804 RepID=A0A5C3EF83_9BASI|nr:uncharacterized protein UTRI_04744 [Ustilago trichophora]
MCSRAIVCVPGTENRASQSTETCRQKNRGSSSSWGTELWVLPQHVGSTVCTERVSPSPKPPSIADSVYPLRMMWDAAAPMTRLGLGWNNLCIVLGGVCHHPALDSSVAPALGPSRLHEDAKSLE